MLYFIQSKRRSGVCSVSLLPEDCSFSFLILQKRPAARQTYKAFAMVLIGFRSRTMPSGYTIMLRV